MSDFKDACSEKTIFFNQIVCKFLLLL